MRFVYLIFCVFWLINAVASLSNYRSPGADESHRHAVISPPVIDPRSTASRRPWIDFLWRTDRCLFDSDRLGVDRFAVAPESIFVAQTPLALFKAPQSHPTSKTGFYQRSTPRRLMKDCIYE